MSLPTNYIRINCNGPFHFISAPPPPLLRVKEILGGGRGSSEGVLNCYFRGSRDQNPSIGRVGGGGAGPITKLYIYIKGEASNYKSAECIMLGQLIITNSLTYTPLSLFRITYMLTKTCSQIH